MHLIFQSVNYNTEVKTVNHEKKKNYDGGLSKQQHHINFFPVCILLSFSVTSKHVNKCYSRRVSEIFDSNSCLGLV